MAGYVETIQLEPHDDVITVRDRLAFVEKRHVLLVWPPGAPILQRKLDLVLIQREAKRRAIRLAIVSNDLLVVDHARELNISAFSSLQDSRKQRWQRGRTKVFYDRKDKPQSDPAPEALRGVASRLREDPTPSQQALRRALRIVVLFALLIMLAAALYVFVPSATITLTPARERLDVTIRITADVAAQQVDIENGVIPAQVLRIEIEDSAVVETTGSLDVEETLAGGLVVFTNQTEQPVFIPPGTTVATSAGAIVRFRTIEPITVEGQVNAIAAVSAQALPEFPGPQGNVRAFAINHIDGPLNDVLAVQNPDPMQGGESPSTRIVAEADFDRVLAAARQTLQQRAFDDLQPLLGAGQEIIPETIGIVEERPEWTTFDAAAGDVADTLSVTVRAAIQAVVIDRRQMNQAAFAGLTARLPQNRAVVPDTVRFTIAGVETIDPAGRITFLTNVVSSVAASINIDVLRQDLAGRSMESALSYLQTQIELDPASPPGIVIRPEFFGQLPALPARITIRVQESE